MTETTLFGNINKSQNNALIGSDKISIPKPSVVSEQRNYRECPNVSTTSYLINQDTGRTIPINCGRYDCPVCGEKKIWRLKRAIFNYIKKWDRVRMMTLTLSSKVGDSPEEHYKVLQECWRRFITELRRTKSLRADQRNFQFIRVPELHLSGYMHMHLLISHFLDQRSLYVIWNHIIHETTKDVLLGGGVNLKDLPGATSGARYVIKYVTKLLSENTFITRRYSTSGEVVLFAKTHSSGRWQFVFGIRPSEADQRFDELMSFFTCIDKVSTSQGEIADDDSDPPF